MSAGSRMKLLVHNCLSSRFLKNVNMGFPLKLVATEINVSEQEFNPEFVKRMLPKLDYQVFRDTAVSIGHGQDLPETLPQGTEAMDDGETASTTVKSSEIDYDESFLKAVHKNLLELEIVTGYLECPESGRKFPIKAGIPNMLANEDEVK